MSRPPKPSRLFLKVYHHRRQLLLFIGVIVVVWILLVKLFSVGGPLRWVVRYMDCYVREAGVVWHLAPISDLERPCPPSNYRIETKPQRICITTLTDRNSSSKQQRFWRCRDFDKVNSFDNHQHYAAKHGYTIRDGSDLIDSSRPPAWSKIRAVQKLMTRPYECDWIMWLDADVVIMNSDIRIELLLPADRNIHLVATYDRKFAFNSGSWLLRNSNWSHQFLETWWGQTQLVLPAGASLSGDNAAFGHVLRQSDYKQHVQEVPRCAMNSFAVFLTDQELAGLELERQEWFMSDKFYHKGDFIAHASAVDKKSEAVQMLLERAA